MANSKFILKLSIVPFAIVLLLGFTPQSFSENELKTVAIFVEPPTGLTTDHNMNDNDVKLIKEELANNQSVNTLT